MRENTMSINQKTMYFFSTYRSVYLFGPSTPFLLHPAKLVDLLDKLNELSC